MPKHGRSFRRYQFVPLPSFKKKEAAKAAAPTNTFVNVTVIIVLVAIGILVYRLIVMWRS